MKIIHCSKCKSYHRLDYKCEWKHVYEQINVATDDQIMNKFKEESMGNFICGYDRLSPKGKVELARLFLAMMPEKW